MFIIETIKKEEAKGELKLLYKMIERSLGFVPSHFELFATIDIDAMKEFMLYNQKILAHPKIDKNLLPHLRLAIAKKECRGYCVSFNTSLIEKNQPTYSESQALLLQKVLKAIYEEFSSEDLVEIERAGFTQKDFYDLLNYATDFMAKSKMIEVYLK